MRLTKELFEDVIIYSVSEAGAMGPCGEINCFKKNGDSFVLDFLSPKTSWNEIKKNFPGINGCIFSGPMLHEYVNTNVIILGGSDNDEHTRVNPGWNHMWLGYGNHLVYKEEYDFKLKEIFCNVPTYAIIFEWVEKLKEVKFIEHLN